MKKFIFDHIIYPIFRKQVESKLDDLRPTIVYSVQRESSGKVFVRANKTLPIGSSVLIYSCEKDAYSPEDGYLCTLEKVYAQGKVIEIASNDSKILLTFQKEVPSVGLLVKVI